MKLIPGQHSDRVETCPGMKMRTIPHANNPPFHPGMATVGFPKICGSLEKIYMNPTLKIPNKISATRHGHVRRGPYLYMYKTSVVNRAEWLGGNSQQVTGDSGLI